MATARSLPLEIVRAPGWQDNPWLIHGFSARPGGKTTVYRREATDLNLGFTASDPREIVTANRALFVNAVAEGRELAGLVTLRQIHSSTVHAVSAHDAHDYGLPPTLEGDGLMTDEPGILLAILTADCIPVLVADRKTRAVAAFHAGWRGTVARIVEKGIGRMGERFGSNPKNLVACIGPGIGSCCYAVGDEVRTQFELEFSYAGDLFCKTGPELHLDLLEANRRQLLAAGLEPQAITLTGECTGCSTDRFFSHRIEQGHTGRMMSVIGIAREKAS